MLRVSIAFIATIFLFSGCADKVATPLTHNLDKKEGIYSIKQAKSINMQELVNQVEHYPVIFVGDHHNTEKTHKFFAEFINELGKKGYNLNLANEWFTPSQDELLKEYTDNKFDTTTFKQKIEWDKFSKYKWEYVSLLYEAIKNNGGKLYGMNISKDDRAKISLREFDKMSKEEKSFYDNLDLNVTAHNQLIEPFFKHCKTIKQTDEPCEQRMYRVQVTWDTYMAENAAKIAKNVIKTPKDKLLVFAGALHIEQNLGIPLRFSRLSNLPFISISNEKIENDKDLKIDTNKADFVYIYESVEERSK
ncbi:ChaN family lipoprotein [Aliarcobacter cryaerophilus]|uniref:ChaN family lipoprotein n=1 Tax=Aliarcobacter cryaerophilus TaxID=28198 RepID=UPI0021B2CD45|nr:ChaN family lipoprotein [Aliarcobacter cryaerophilus]MCT7480396.1 ChaN family lipoprotein [Aliarcobacter cryaerophilus]